MANLITLLRLILLVVIFSALEFGGLAGHVWALFLTIVIIALDGLDGVVARLKGESSEFGGVFDIVADRIVENCYWIYFAARGVIPVWVPIIILSRGLITDGIRSVALSRGMTAFGEKSLQRSHIGKTLVTSRASRGLYGFAKVISFLSLIAIKGMGLPEAGEILGGDGAGVISAIGYSVIYFTVAFCLLRGLPVVLDGREFLFAVRGKK